MLGRTACYSFWSASSQPWFSLSNCNS